MATSWRYLVPDSEPGSVTISNIVVVYSEDAA
jgi:hypothetical protein